MIVVDTNLLMYATVGTDLSDLAADVHMRDPSWAVPTLWRSEFRNAAVGLIRKQLLDTAEAISAFGRALAVVRQREYLVDTVEVLMPARRTGSPRTTSSSWSWPSSSASRW